jgi:hypothetical protein
MNMVNEGRIDVDQLLNNLHSSGSNDLNEAARTVLNELLYGWIIETKREFGEAMEKEVMALTSRLQ